jgi:hypothetical protein
MPAHVDRDTCDERYEAILSTLTLISERLATIEARQSIGTRIWTGVIALLAAAIGSGVGAYVVALALK